MSVRPSAGSVSAAAAAFTAVMRADTALAEVGLAEVGLAASGLAVVALAVFGLAVVALVGAAALVRAAALAGLPERAEGRLKGNDRGGDVQDPAGSTPPKRRCRL